MHGTKRTVLALSASLLALALLLGGHPVPVRASTTVYASADTQAPTAPTNFRTTGVTGTTVSLAWNASTDNVGVAAYDIYRSKTLVASTADTAYTVTGLSPNSKYSFSVRARDAAGNRSSAAYLSVRTTSATPPTPPPVTAPARKVVGYFAGWSIYHTFHVSDVDASKLTHINYAFANVTNGTCAIGDSYADPINFDQLLKLKQSYPQLRTLISVGGWNWSSGFSAAASTDASRAAFAAGCVSFIRQYGFDGIDIDWEYPVSGGQSAGQPADKHNFTLLLQALRQQLDQAGTTDGKQYLLTIAGGAGSGYLANTEMDLAHPYLDWINVMAYDFAGPWMSTTGHNAPLYGAASDNTALQGYLGKGVPASKLVLGVPFYARGFDNVTPVNNGLNQPYSGLPPGTYDAGVYDYNDLAANYINLNGYTRYWDDTAKEPWLFNGKVFITYEDPTSVGFKTDYIKTQGLGGASIWELSNDRGRVLLNALYSGLQ